MPKASRFGRNKGGKVEAENLIVDSQAAAKGE
jgi:hypothetical protein